MADERLTEIPNADLTVEEREEATIAYGSVEEYEARRRELLQLTKIALQAIARAETDEIAPKKAVSPTENRGAPSAQILPERAPGVSR